MYKNKSLHAYKDFSTNVIRTQVEKTTTQSSIIIVTITIKMNFLHVNKSLTYYPMNVIMISQKPSSKMCTLKRNYLLWLHTEHTKAVY